MLHPGLMACFLLLLITSSGCSHSPETKPAPRVPAARPLQRFEYEQAQMGVPFKMILFASDEQKAEIAARAAFARIEALNAILSDYETDSELMLLSRQSGSGKAVRVSDDLWQVLNISEQFAAESHGAFDVTVGPCVNLWRKARREKKMPDEELLHQVRARVGYDKVQLHPGIQSVELQSPNMRLDLGGIAKGYAVDEAMKVLKAHGIQQALVAGSGDLLVSKAPPGKMGWTVELSSFDEGGGPKSQFVFLENKAVATSGDVFQRLEIDGTRYSHILNPRTCIGLTNHSLVTVIAENCTTADAMATTLSVLPSEEALPFATRRKVAVRLIEKPAKIVETTENSFFREIIQNNGFTHERESYESIWEGLWFK